jgi:hypothetical protein
MTTTALENHLQQKWANQEWLYRCCENDETYEFPYSLASEGDPELLQPFIPSQPSTTQITAEREPHPQFLVNIPMGRFPSMSADRSKYTRLLDLLRDESFGKTPAESSAKVKSRVAVVIGVNQIQSIDSRMNRVFRRFVRNLPRREDVVVRTIGFLWKPVWIRTSWKPKLYALHKAFLILKCLSPATARKVLKEYETPQALASQIPYQKIRETIKNCRETRTLAENMETTAPRSPIYYTTMDADCISLRPEGVQDGIFSRFEQLIAQHNQPSIASLGYSVEEDEPPLLRLAVKMDMKVRSTMPMPYFPEPCTSYKVRLPEQSNFLSSMSFIGGGRSLESRRFIKNGSAKLKDGAVFKGDGGVVTTTPARMKTEYNQEVDELSTAILKKKKSLQGLRGRTLQTHAFPKQWADILYAGLPFSAKKVTDATGPMMHLFSVYDPISQMFDTTKYTTAVFDRVMNHYCDPLTPDQITLINTARGQLINLGMQKEMIDLVQETAKRSGRAIYDTLRQTLDDLD